jgi:hypothetical protein
LGRGRGDRLPDAAALDSGEATRMTEGMGGAGRMMTGGDPVGLTRLPATAAMLEMDWRERRFRVPIAPPATTCSRFLSTIYAHQHRARQMHGEGRTG